MASNLNLAAGLITAQTAINTTWQEVEETAPEGTYRTYAQSVPSDGDTILMMNWIANHPVMRVWRGARVYKAMRHYSTTITMEKYEASFFMDRTLVEQDKTGLINRAVQMSLSGTASEASIDRTVAEQFDSNSGAGPTGYDGVALFSASHPNGPAAATQSNLGSGTNLSANALIAAEAAGANLRHENGENAMGVGASLKRRVLDLLSQDRLQGITAGGVLDASASLVAAATRSNSYAGEFTPILDARVTTYFWDLLCTTKPVKAMVHFDIQKPEPQMVTDPNDSGVFNNDQYLYGLRGLWGIGAGHWLTCYRGTGTA
jgi:phage major head subunit gpT-like protein